MKYNAIIIEILSELGVHKMYKGTKYLLSCIDYIDRNKEGFLPITKILYVDIAKLHGTSKYNVEKGIRSIIELIWSCEENKELLEKIFGHHNAENRPANTEFLIALHQYIKARTGRTNEWNKDYVFVCPTCKEQCPYCKDIVMVAMGEKSCQE